MTIEQIENAFPIVTSSVLFAFFVIKLWVSGRFVTKEEHKILEENFASHQSETKVEFIKMEGQFKLISEQMKHMIEQTKASSDMILSKVDHLNSSIKLQDSSEKKTLVEALLKFIEKEEQKQK